MPADCSYLPYSRTNRFSKIVVDYTGNADELKPFYQHKADIDGIKASIEARKNFANRPVLVNELKKQYENVDTNENVLANISLLLNENCFTITTAHQPNIFTGPLYFIYKILHAIKLAAELSDEFKDKNFVPVYYMGSEDADFDELSYINIDGKKYQWQAKQTGAVGRMKVDKALIALIAEMRGQLAVQPFGNELINIFSKYYTEGKPIQQATLEVVNHLFGKYGLIVLIPDNANLKNLFAPVIEKELKEQFSHKAVEETAKQLKTHYKVQAQGRELNLFYLIDDKRERIEVQNAKYEVRSLGLEFSQGEILQLLKTNSERFSPNVILRGALQETILPNIAFIGGGSEIAYWLELKKVFDAVSVPFPVLILRNSFAIVEKEHAEKIKSLGLHPQEMFMSEFELMNKITLSKSHNKTKLTGEIEKIIMAYAQAGELAGHIDKTLTNHVQALQTKALNRLHELEKKMLRAEKRKFETEKTQLQKIRTALFPNEGLQERTENLASFYAKYGNAFIDLILQYSTGMKQEFCILSLAASK